MAINGTTGDDTLNGTAGSDAMYGLAGDDSILAGSGNDILDGGTGNDTMVGGVGNDDYYVDSTDDVVVETLNQGTDTVYASISYTLGSDVEKLTLTGTGNLDATGNELANLITGNAGNNTLDGGTGKDTMVGGAGNDTYIVENTGDAVTEAANGGTDTVRASINYTLGLNVENLVLTGSGNLNGTGNTLANNITSTAGNNTLDGGTGNDTLTGGDGNDVYIVDSSLDVIVEASSEGTDTVMASASYSLATAANVENLTLTGIANINATGNADDNVITGNDGNNTLSGGTGGDDTLIGGKGNDTYLIDSTDDVITETASNGTDTVITGITYTLATGNNVENLTLTGSSAIDATGNELKNVLTGNTGNNSLDGGAGADTMAGGLGNDVYVVDNTLDVVTELATAGTDSVLASVNYTLGVNVENLTLTGSGNINGTGNTVANVITGNAGNNTLDGGLGNDTLIGGDGNDVYIVDSTLDVVTEASGEGTDTIMTSLTYTLANGSNVENLTLTGVAAINATGNADDNVLTGNAGNNTLTGGAGNDTMIGGLGNDTYIIDSTDDVITELVSGGTDTVIAGFDYSLNTLANNNLENLTITGTGNFNATGNSFANVLTGNSGNNTLDGGLGADTMIGGAGNDTYLVNISTDVITELVGGGTDTVITSNSYTLGANIENLTLSGTASINGTGNIANNVILGNDGNNTLDGGLGNDTLTGGLGNDTYVIDNINDVIVENSGEGTDTVMTAVSYTLSGNIENLVLTGTTAINGTGDSGNNTIMGNAGNNTLDGGAGNDSMVGGLGNDTYIMDSTDDIIVEAASGGTDTVVIGANYTLATNFENLTLSGTGNFNGVGNGVANVLTGNSGNNSLDGGVGADTMAGGAGDDVYTVDNTLDVITELLNGGTDSVSSSVSYTLSANVENLTLTGSGNLNGTGNIVNNSITGTAGNNTLDGGAGADTLIGGAGNDTYIVDNTDDVVTEVTGEGTDTVMASNTYTLGSFIENLTLTGTTAINGTGNTLDNAIIGNAGNNTLDGGAGNDTMTGGLGNDTYILDSTNDVIVEVASGGTDTVVIAATYTLATNFENLTLSGTGNFNGTGNTVNNAITGNAGNNTLDGGTGNDTLVGGAGNDVYIIDSTGDVVTELTGEGTDLVNSAVNFTLGANIENLTLTGSASVNGTGNALDNTITGNTGNNTLDGGVGNDTLIGGTGNDVYFVDSTDDVITEASGEGTDTVNAATTYTLGANLENLILTGTANVNGIGNTLNNSITGNAGNNTLDGGTGNDTLAGGLGNDLYILDNSLDVVTELAAAGTDSVQAGFSYSLGANVENLTLSGTGNFNGTGNLLNNAITGNAGDNSIDGGAGNDTMVGGAGNDVYTVDSTADVVTELTGEGTDLVNSAVNFTLGANIENLILTGTASTNGVGNALDNSITGNAGNNTLDGGAGNDTLVGGAGNDTYIVDSTDDVITETASNGTDTVIAGLTYTLATNFENLTLSGTGNFNAVGNTVANILTGNAGNNTLDGGTGNDTMTGGLGNDTYIVDSTGDVVTELAGAGTDSVIAGVTYTLGTNLENLTLSGTGNTNGFGNELANAITGNAGNNTLDGKAGNDTLVGGDGNDVYIVDSLLDVVTEASGEGTDSVQASVTYTLGANVENLTLTGILAINGVGNALDNSIAGNAGNNTLDGGAGNDTMVGGLGNDYYIVDSTDDVVTEAASGGTDTVRTALAYTLGSDVENLILTGTGNVDGTGNALANSITGNAGNNTLSGGAGNDTMIGGAGNDVYIVDSSLDVITELANGGTDSVIASASYVLSDQIENLTLGGTSAINGTGNALNNTITGNSGANTLDGKVGADTMIGGDGNDVYLVDNVGDVVTEASGEGTDSVFSTVNFTLGANVENLTLAASAALAATTLTAINGFGNALDNSITGNGGNNTLDGGAGNDTMAGGLGNDTYFVDSTGDVVTEAASAGTDTVSTALAYTLGANLENLILTGSGDVDGTGNALNNSLTGNAGNNTLDGGAGNDTMAGGAGNDYYLVDSTLDVVTELANGGTDTVSSSVTFSLSANVENLILTGTGNNNGTGNVLNNTITGNAGNNTLDGGVGADTMIGGAGNDTYIVDNTGDVVTEASSGGTDVIRASVSYSLASYSDVENLTLTGATVGYAIGNSGNNVITGSTGDNSIDGNGGTDTMIGGLGNDSYRIDSTDDVITENLNEGTDTVYTSLNNYTLGANLEKLVLEGYNNINGAGNALANTLTGNDGDNTLDGGVGADTLIGGSGYDTYLVDSTLDVITELADGGVDTVITGTTSYSLATAANVENITLTGSGAYNITGNILDNTLTGNSGANSLDGGAGADTMIGGAGNDVYVVDNTGDVVTEGSAAGTDTVLSTISYTLGDNLENLTLNGATAINGTGNTLNNVITGNTGNNTLDGGTGADTMIGGLGNDTYIVNSTDDVVTEATGGGLTDTVRASITYTLGSELEQLVLTANSDGTFSNINGTGNALNNVLIGNDGNNSLDGGIGNDTMKGGIGNDTYVIDSTADLVVENADEGTDTVISGITYTLTSNVENLTLSGTGNLNATGNELDNVLTGNAGNNTLDGKVGADTMIGGAGNDTYLVDSTGDVVTEGSAAGTDTIIASLTYSIDTLTNIENLTLSGIGNFDATGNTGANSLTGNTGNNTLDGGAGNDTLAGGAGNDTYIVDSTGDVVTELAGQGTDTINSSVTYTLGSNVENLALTGTGNINATGNELDNVLTSNTGNNTLTGGAGNDTYRFGINNGTDVISDSAGTADKLVFDATVSADNIAVFMSGGNLQIGYNNTDTSSTITINGQGTAGTQIENFTLDNGGTMTAAQMNTLISDMSAYATSSGTSFTSLADVRASSVLQGMILAAFH